MNVNSPGKKLIYARTGLTATTAGTLFDLEALVGPGTEASEIYVENTAATNDVFAGLDLEIAATKTDGSANTFRIRPNSQKSRLTRFKKVSFLTSSSTQAYDFECWG